ncbi:MAG: hypothetical protein KGL39_20510 [Patescibacteria group bacterium]|nr:hypothetical protein [Patescibacteria group bacterium]
MADLSKLTPGKWASVGPCEANPLMPFALVSGKELVAWYKTEADCDLAALSRNFVDVLERRRWSLRAVRDGSNWVLSDDNDDWPARYFYPSLLAAMQAAVDLDDRLTKEGK